MSDLFFVLGRGRSGTTLLSRMLGQHPRMAVAPEGFFAMNLRHRYGRAPLMPDRVQAFCTDLVRENRMKTWGLDLPRVARRLSEAHGPVPYAEVCARVYESYAQDVLGKASATHFGDKNPHYALLAARLLDTFPKARFIHVVRDPRDNVLSYKAVPFDLADTRALAYRWRAYNGRLLRARAQAKERVFQIRYEDLLRAPEDTLTSLSAFLGLPYDPAMLAFERHDDENFYGKDSAWFGALRGPLDPAQSEKWRTALAPADIAEIEAICGPMMDALGYARTTSLPLRAWPHAAAGAALGALSVATEDLIFAALPAGARIALINRYRKQSGRI